MAEQVEAAGTKPAASGKGQMLPLIGVAVAALLIGGAGSWFVFAPKGDDAGKPESAEAAAAAEHGEAPAEAGAKEGAEAGDTEKGEHAGAEGGAAAGGEQAPLSERLITLEPFVVNLDESGAKRFLRTKIELETRSPAARAELQTRSAQMRDSIIVLLTSKRLDDLGGFEGKVILKNEIEKRLDDMLGGDPIRSVLITEFVIQ